MQVLKHHAKLDLGYTAELSYFCVKLVPLNKRTTHNSMAT